MTEDRRADVLDHGYVRYIHHMGSDLDVINSAKVSFAKESAEFGEREARLLGFLAREEHTSVFRHSAITFECYAPLLVARQWWKYVVASAHLDDQNGWNESSRRYITEEPTFYIPNIHSWRMAPENKKQGSAGLLPHKTPEREWKDGLFWSDQLEKYINQGVFMYEKAIENGIAPEQARLFLPAYGMYVRWRWTVSLGGVMHFLHQRLEHDAQWEIQQYARAIKDLTTDHFPVTMGLL